MSEELLAYYDRELSRLRDDARRFAEREPHKAAALRLGHGPDGFDDPHAERIIQSVAYLTARIRRRLDDDFPELPLAMLSVIDPTLIAPVPSMMIVQMLLSRGQTALPEGLQIERGRAIETSEESLPDPLRYRTCSEVRLWPLEVTSVELLPSTLTRSSLPIPASVRSILVVQLRCTATEPSVRKLQLDSLRFFVAGDSSTAGRLHQLIVNHAVGIAAAVHRTGEPPTELIELVDAESRPIIPLAAGLGSEDAALPDSPHGLPAHRLLMEYFALPAKFRFFEVAGLDRLGDAGDGDRLELRFLLDQDDDIVSQRLRARASQGDPPALQLGCTAAVNLYEHDEIETIELDGRRALYPIVLGRGNGALSHEVYWITGIELTVDSADGTATVEVPAFYDARLDHSRSQAGCFWHAVRTRPGEGGASQEELLASVGRESEPDHGTDMSIAFVDLAFDPTAPVARYAHVRALCFNRDRPSKAPTGSQLGLVLVEESAQIDKITCLVGPTPVRRSSRPLLWQLVSHLTLNHVPLATPDGSADALRELLALHERADARSGTSRVQAIRAVRSRPIVATIDGRSGGGLCRGVEIEIEIDQARFPDNEWFLFSTVMERFLSLHCSINSFTRLAVRLTGQERLAYRGRPLASDRALHPTDTSSEERLQWMPRPGVRQTI